MVRAMHTIRPGTRLGEATRRFASFFGADCPEPFDAEPLAGMETLQRSERVFYSVPTYLDDAMLPPSYVSIGQVDGPEAVRQIRGINDWAVSDADVTLYHDDCTLHHETWFDLAYTGSEPSMEGARDSVLYAGVLEHGVTASEARRYLNDPDGNDIAPEAAYQQIRSEARVEMEDVVSPDSERPVQVRERVEGGAAAAAYLDDRLSGDVFFDESPATELRQYGGDDAYHIVAETSNGRTVFRPA